MTIDWTQVLIVGITSFTTIITGLLGIATKKQIEQRKKRREPHRYIFDKIVSVYDILGVLRRETRAQRVLIISVHNGGGTPKIGGKYKISVLFEDVEGPLRAVKADWQNRPVDDHYIKLMANVLTDGRADIFVDKLEESILKQAYDSECIKHSSIYKIADGPNQMIIMSLACTTTEPFDARERNTIDGALNKLTEIIKADEVAPKWLDKTSELEQ